jgi:hypothetical protein
MGCFCFDGNESATSVIPVSCLEAHIVIHHLYGERVSLCLDSVFGLSRLCSYAKTHVLCYRFLF